MSGCQGSGTEGDREGDRGRCEYKKNKKDTELSCNLTVFMSTP